MAQDLLSTLSQPAIGLGSHRDHLARSKARHSCGVLVRRLLACGLWLFFASSVQGQCPCRNSGPNLVQNGDFTAGAVGFTTDAQPGGRNAAQDRFWVVPAANFHGGWSGAGNPGNFLLLDNPTPGLAWRQTVQGVFPGQQYCISVDVMDVNGQDARPQLQMQIDGVVLGTRIVNTNQGAWTTWTLPWTSTANAPSSAVLSIFALGAQGLGHDFGLDNIRVMACCPRSVLPNPVFEVQLPSCPGEPIQGTATQPSADLVHQWVIGETDLKGELVGGEMTACFGPNCTLPLQPGKCYRVKHGMYGACQTWVERRKMVCVPKAVGVTPECRTEEVCERITCKPGETPYDDECGCGCLQNPESCPQPLAEAGPDRVLCPNSRMSDVQIGSPGQEGCSYAWSPAAGLSDSAAAQPTVWWRDDLGSVIYIVTATCASGCLASDAVTVRTGAEAGILKLRSRGRFPFLSCGQQADLALSGHSANGFEWECAPSAGGPWSACPGAVISQPAYTTEPLNKPLFVRVRVQCGGINTDLSNVVALNPFCTVDPPIDLGTAAEFPSGVVFDLPVPENPSPPPSSNSEPATEPSAEPSALTACTRLTTAGGTMCACGRFPSESAMSGVRLGDEPVQKTEANPQRILLRVPETLEPGEHRLYGDSAAGFGPSDVCSFRLVRLTGSLAQDELFRGQGTDLEIRVEGTREPVRVRLVNSTPQIITIEGGDDQVIESSGGRKNRVERRVRGLQRGDFKVDWTLLDTECPCD